MTKPRQCGCGRWGCLEAYASASSVVKRTLEVLDQNPTSSLAVFSQKPETLTAKDIFAEAAAGDALGAKIVEETAYYLAVGATNMLHTIDPDMVVFAGGMVAAGDAFLDQIRRYVHKLAFPVPASKSQIRYAQLGSDAGYIGAAACARSLISKHKKD
jgi:glucokinase